ncbi:MAG: hypothetical protein IT356_04870 [Gemmatimonadaceae bacterium]|nr:hypothetical protein [Gemmatimonadaceae bacterium]
MRFGSQGRRAPTAMRLLGAGAVATALAAAPRPAGGQDYLDDRRGIAAAVGGGLSSAGLNCNPRCSGDRRAGPVFTARGIGYITPHLAVAVSADGYYQSVARAGGAGRWQMNWFTLGAMWYPREDGDVYFRAGMGAAIMHAHTTFPSVGALDLDTRHVGFVAGVGRDYRLWRGYGVTAFADYLFTPRSTGYLYGVESGAEVGADVLTIGIAAIVF